MSARRRKKTALVLPRSALPCPGQPSSGCEAGSPLELSLEGALRPRHRGCMFRGAERRSDRAPEVSRTDCAQHSHTHILTLPVLPANQPISTSTTTVLGKPDIGGQTDAHYKSALFPLFRPQTSPTHQPQPFAPSRLQSGSNPIAPSCRQPDARHRHRSGCLTKPGRAPSRCAVARNRGPNKITQPTPSVESRYQPAHPAMPVPLSQNLSRMPHHPMTSQLTHRPGGPSGGRERERQTGPSRATRKQLATPNCPRFNSTQNRRVCFRSRLSSLVLLTARFAIAWPGPPFSPR